MKKHTIKTSKVKFLHTLLILIFAISSTLGVNSQNDKKLDSLLKIYKELPEDTTKVNILHDLYSATAFSDVEKSKTFAKELIVLSKKIKFESGIALGYYNLGGYYKNIYMRDSARYWFNKALEIHKKRNDEMKIVMVNYSNSILEMEEGNYNKALEISNINIKKRQALKDSLGLAIEYVFRSGIHEEIGNHKIAYNDILSALKLYNILDEPIRKADALYSLGSLEGIFGNHEKGIQYNKEALEIYKANNDKLYEALVYSSLGQKNIEIKKYDTAKEYLQKSIKLSKEMQNIIIEATATRSLGRVFMAQGNSIQGIKHFEKAIELHRANEMQIELLRSLAYTADAYNDIKKPNVSISYLNEAIEIVKSEGVLNNWGELYQGKSKSWELLGDYKKSLADYKKYQVLRDSVFKTEKTKQINELRTIYDTERKEQEITLQKNEIDLLEQKEKVSTLQKSLLGGGLLLTLGIVGVGFYGFRQKIKRSKLEKEKVDTELAFKKKELTTHALHLAKKNEVLESLKQKAEELKEKETSKNGYQQLIRTINFDLQDDNNWDNFSKYFQEVHKDFNWNVKQKFPEVTSNELRLMSLLKMNLSSKEIANILNISQEGIKKARYRLRKKLHITTEDSLQDLVLSL